MRSLEWTLIQYGWCPYKNGKSGLRDTHEEEGRDQGDLSASRETPKVANKAPEARREAWNAFSSPRHLRKGPTWPVLELRLWPPELRGDTFFAALATQWVVLCYVSPTN